MSDPAARTAPANETASPRDELLAKLRERILGFAASRIQRDAAEDLTQEVLVLLHIKYAHVDRLDDLLPLALQILRFKLMAHRRKSVRHGEYTQTALEDLSLVDPAANPLTVAERQQRRERLTKAIAKMGDRCRDMFRLKLEGKNFGEIQVILGAGSINTVYAWDFRCRKQLLEHMGGSWEAKG